VKGDDRLRSCRNCGRETREGRLDSLRWCQRCREIVIRKAGRWARVVALLTAILTAVAIAFRIGTPNFLVLWAVLLVAVYAFVFLLARRIAFEIIRARGVDPEA
jgi:hypothetical protein